MSLEKETIQKAVLLIENVIEKSKKHSIFKFYSGNNGEFSATINHVDAFIFNF